MKSCSLVISLQRDDAVAESVYHGCVSAFCIARAVHVVEMNVPVYHCDKVKQLSVADMFAEAIRRVIDNKSISDLYII